LTFAPLPTSCGNHLDRLDPKTADGFTRRAGNFWELRYASAMLNEPFGVRRFTAALFCAFLCENNQKTKRR
jgi:hypothetical protein